MISEKLTVLRPLDVVILLKKLTPEGSKMNGKQLAATIGISAAEVSLAMERNRSAQLVDNSKKLVNTMALRDFLIYGIRYCFPAQPGRIVRGFPTASSAFPMNSTIAAGEETFVWADSGGERRGQSIVPLYGNAVFGAKNDADFYALLAIVDSLRIGKSRERQAAIDELDKYLKSYVESNQ